MKEHWHVINFTDGTTVPAVDGNQAYDMMAELARRHKDVVSILRKGEAFALFRPKEAERIKAQRAQSRLVLPASARG